jgi:hypothetical protein
MTFDAPTCAAVGRGTTALGDMHHSDREHTERTETKASMRIQ